MSRDLGRLALVAALLLSAAPPKVDADQIDVRGNWQVNINCDLNATASIFLLLDEDVASGSTTVRYSDCGTFEVPSAIRNVSSCMFTPNPVVGQVEGTDFELPTSGLLGSTAVVTPPFPFLTCSAASELLVAHHLSGTITTDHVGQAVSIDGTWANAQVVFRDTTGATCWSVTNPPSCSFDMRRNDVPVGDDVTISPRAKTTVTFEHVTRPGTVEVVPLTEAGGTVPEQFQVVGSGGVPIFYEVRTTATFAGIITTCFPYPDKDGDGIVDGSNPPLDETQLRVLHAEGGVFVDRTTSLDTTAKIVCGQTMSLSQLTIAHLPAPPSRDYDLFGSKLVFSRRPSRTGGGSFLGAFLSPIVPGGLTAPDPREGGLVLELFSTDQTVLRLGMQAEGWELRRKGQVFRFLNRLAPNSISLVRLAVLRVYAPHALGNLPFQWRGHLRIESPALGAALDNLHPFLGVRVTVGDSRYCDIFRSDRTMPNKMVARSFGVSPLDCADKRIWWSLRSAQCPRCSPPGVTTG